MGEVLTMRFWVWCIALLACGGSPTRTASVHVAPSAEVVALIVTDAGSSAPPPSPFLRDVSQLSVGDAHVCAVTTDHAVVCWGDNAAGELGVGNDGRYVGKSLSRPHVVGRLPEIASVVAGKMHTCALDTRGAVHRWGSAGGDLVETGGGASGSIELRGARLGTPVRMPLGAGEAHLVALSRITSTACAAFVGDVRCWSTFRAIPIDGGKVTSLPSLRTTNIAGVTAMAIEHGKVCVIADKKLSCWHDGDAPSFAVWGQGRSFEPVAIALGEMYACVASAAGDVRCWWSIIDDFWRKPPNRDVRWPGKPPTRAIAVGDSPICTADANGRVDCFLSDEGGLPDDAVAASWASTKLESHPIAGIDGAIDLGLGAGRNVMGFGFGCAMRATPDATGAQVFCWGDNESGQLGHGDDVSTKSAVPVISRRAPSRSDAEAR